MPFIIMEAARIFNFAAGPSTLPIEVIKKAHEQFVNYEGTGMNVMEMSHRSKEYVKIWNNIRDKIRTMLKVPKDYHIYLLQGGGTLQFSAAPLHILAGKDKANYLVTGAWSKKGIEEAAKYCTPVKVWKDYKGPGYTTVPDKSTWNVDKSGAYFYYCMNETIDGVEIKDFPYEMAEGMPLVCDMSSNFMSMPIQVEKYGIIFAGAQKNLGPAGCTVAIIRDDLIALGKKSKFNPLDD